MKRLQNIIRAKVYPASLVVLLLAVWQVLSVLQVVPAFMLPSPLEVAKAFVSAFPELLRNSGVTLEEAFTGLFIGILLAFFSAVLMDSFNFFYKAGYPLLIITQAVPSIAIAPLLVLWLGYGAAPKIVLVVIVCFFPLAVGLLDSFRQVDQDVVRLFKSMGAGKLQIFRRLKLPSAISGFFSGLKISVSYSVVGAVIAEWLGGNSGLGVYMTRVRKSYAFDKMFAVIFLIIILSIALMWIVTKLEKRLMPWKKYEK